MPCARSPESDRKAASSVPLRNNVSRPENRGGIGKSPRPASTGLGLQFPARPGGDQPRRGDKPRGRTMFLRRGSSSGDEWAPACVKRTNVPLSWRSRQPSQSQNRVCRVLRRSRLDRSRRHPMKLGQCGASVADPEGAEREQAKHNSGRSSREDTDACRPRFLAIEWNQARLSAFAEQLVDATLELAFLLLAAAQPHVEVALGRVGNHGAEREADAVRLPPNHAGEE